MIEIEKELFNMYSSLEKLESLDKHYYKIDTFNNRDFRTFLRCNIIDSNKLDWFNNCSNNIYKHNIRDIPNIQILDFMYSKVGLLDTITSYRFKDSFRKKTIRLRKRIDLILEKDNLFFLTFTFDDKQFKGHKLPSQQTLRKYVNRWLNWYVNDYVGNVDFGGEKGRIHFHAVVSAKDNIILGNSWFYGALNFKRIKTKNDKALALYVNKLCNHALKESTKQQYLLFPKLKNLKNS